MVSVCVRDQLWYDKTSRLVALDLPSSLDTLEPPISSAHILPLLADPRLPPAAPGPLPRLEPYSPAIPSLDALNHLDPGADIPRQLHYIFRSPDAALDRCITLHLPVAYTTEPERRFPVLYLHDGQNLFDPETAYLPGHTWRADSTADSLTEEGQIEPIILVGINNAGLRRMAEYTPDADPRLGGGEGERYGRLLLDELKPLLDQELRTLAGPEHTGLGGSSLGGLISLSLALTHRQQIGRIAVMSPSVWWNDRSILAEVRVAEAEPELRIWLDMGTAEGARHLRDTDQLYALLLSRGWEAGRTLLYQRAPEGVHNEDAWAARLPDVLRFLFPTPATPTPHPAANSEPCPPPF